MILEKLRVMRTANAADMPLDAMLENYIFYISRMYEFSHSLDPTATLAVHCGNRFDAGFGLYQNTCLRR
jgi:hypothetical protein